MVSVGGGERANILYWWIVVVRQQRTEEKILDPTLQHSAEAVLTAQCVQRCSRSVLASLCSAVLFGSIWQKIPATCSLWAFSSSLPHTLQFLPQSWSWSCSVLNNVMSAWGGSRSRPEAASRRAAHELNEIISGFEFTHAASVLSSGLSGAAQWAPRGRVGRAPSGACWCYAPISLDLHIGGEGADVHTLERSSCVCEHLPNDRVRQNRCVSLNPTSCHNFLIRHFTEFTLGSKPQWGTKTSS